MKQEVDRLVAKDDQIQHFLAWVEQKSSSVKVSYKPAAIRAFYFARDRDRGRDLDLDRALDRDLDLDLALNRDRALDRDLDLDLTLALVLALALDLTRDRALVLARALDLTRDLDRALALDLNRDIVLALDRARDSALDRARALALDPELKRSLQTLRDQLPDPSHGNEEQLKRWWQTNGTAWAEQLRTAMVQHRNIGHDWQFSPEQNDLLSQYYNANKLLVDCLNSDCYVSREVRQEIETGLLLPRRS